MLILSREQCYRRGCNSHRDPWYLSHKHLRKQFSKGRGTCVKKIYDKTTKSGMSEVVRASLTMHLVVRYTRCQDLHFRLPRSSGTRLELRGGPSRSQSLLRVDSRGPTCSAGLRIYKPSSSALIASSQGLPRAVEVL